MHRASSPNRGLGYSGKSAQRASAAQKFLPVDLQSPDQLLQTEIPMHEFSNALFASLDTLPDVPHTFCKYEPQNPIETPSEYPQEPNQRILQPEFFRRFDLSTLFYIFFYFPGTPQQLFASKELKARGWRFHSRFQTWFRRISEPKNVTKESETADFDYFDHTSANGWCIRRRNDFKFEYDFLDTD
jgi:CCR4-NOT transcription complex subunit 3